MDLPLPCRSCVSGKAMHQLRMEPGGGEKTESETGGDGMSRHPKADLYLADRRKGMTYREIAEKHGVSYQCVHTVCTRVDGTYRNRISEKGCIYPNLRHWLNKDRRRSAGFFKAMKGYSIRDFMNGTRQPKKDAIDKMIALTGMNYEELFREEDYGKE